MPMTYLLDGLQRSLGGTGEVGILVIAVSAIKLVASAPAFDSEVPPL